MKQFSKKTDLTVLIITSAAFFVSAALILFSAEIFTFIQYVAETKVVHHPLNPATIHQKITPFIVFPAFAVIVFDALFFVKFAAKSKIILLAQFCLAALILTVAACFLKSPQYMNSDMASEIMLAKECFTHKTFWPRTWHYSTEIRLLHTQLIASPLFAFTSSWLTVKALSAVILCFALPFSLLFLLNALKIKSIWLKLLCSLLIFLPWSDTMWGMVQLGNYYIPHIAISFVYTALFISLAYAEPTARKAKIFTVLFFALAFISGLSGIRPILNFQLPIAATIIALAVHRMVSKQEEFNFSRFFIADKPIFYASANIVLGGVGYVANSLVLSKFFHFLKYNDKVFNAIGDVPLSELHRDIFGLFGFQSNVQVSSPAGVNNVVLYIAALLFIISFVPYLKNQETGYKRIFILLAVVMIIINTFVTVHTDYQDRYLIPALVYCVPCFALFLESAHFSPLKKYLLGVSASVVFIGSSFVTFADILTAQGNEDKREVCRFLDKNYSFGYATFWNANILTFMTDGRLEFGNLEPDTINKIDYIPQTFHCHLWLTPDRFYHDDYKADVPVFLLVTQEEYDKTPEHNIFRNGREVYSDDFYRVFDYENKCAFINGFSNAE
ncbi:MAG: hypothetical protein ACTTKL_06045 [Treponema sp.]